MEYIYAALLLHKLKVPITEEAVANVIKAAHGEPSDIQLKLLIQSLQDIDIDKIIQTTAVPQTSVAIEKKIEEVKQEEEKKEEEKEDPNKGFEGLTDLFGGM